MRLYSQGYTVDTDPVTRCRADYVSVSRRYVS